MPKITRHGGPTNEAETLAAIEVVLAPEMAPYYPDAPMGESEPEESVYLTLDEWVEPKEDESSVGNSYSQSSRPTQTIDELLGKDHP